MDTPKGLVGKTYLTWDSPIELAMMENVVKADGGDWSKVKRIPNTVTDEAQDVKQIRITQFGYLTAGAELTLR